MCCPSRRTTGDIGKGKPSLRRKATNWISSCPPGELSPLGEVIVSYPQAKRQAEERGVRLEHELALLVVHGVLHLTGHDHLELQETKLMRSREQAALAKLNIHA